MIPAPIFILALLAAGASNTSAMPSRRAQCDDLLQQRVGRSIDYLIFPLGSRDAYRDYVCPDQPGVSHRRASMKVRRNRRCGKLDVYTIACDMVTGYPKVPTNP